MYEELVKGFRSVYTRNRSSATSPIHTVPEGRVVSLRGRGTTFVHEVAGPPGAQAVMLLHGWSITSALNWPGAFTALGRHFRVVAFDQRGHGRGIRSKSPFQFEDCADDVSALADALGIERFIPVGYSMSGPTAMLAARRHPDRVAGMVLCATRASFRDRTSDFYAPFVEGLGMAIRWSPPSMQRQMVGTMLRQANMSPQFCEELVRHDPATVLEALSALRRFDARLWADALALPTAVVVTTRDQLVPPDDQRELAQLMSATVHCVDDGHDVAARRPDRFLSALLEATLSVAGLLQGESVAMNGS